MMARPSQATPIRNVELDAGSLAQRLLPNLIPLVGDVSGPGCIRWSADGQVLVILRTGLHIITFALGFDRKFIRQHSIAGEANDTGLNLNCFHAHIKREGDLIAPSRGRTFYNADFAGQSTSFWTQAWRDARWSPVGLHGPLGGCLVAALSNELEVSIFQPQSHKDSRTGHWEQIQKLDFLIAPEVAAREHEDGEDDVGTDLLEPDRQREKELLAEMDSQTICLDWLAAPQGRATRGGTARPSLLATGSRSGILSLWRWDKSQTDAGAMKLYSKNRIFQQQISHVAFSSTTCLVDGCEEFTLACFSQGTFAFQDMSFDADFQIITQRIRHHRPMVDTENWKGQYVPLMCFTSDARHIAWTTTGEAWVTPVNKEGRSSRYRLAGFTESEAPVDGDEFVGDESGGSRAAINRPRSPYAP
ncbi:hypothetical protein K437DRAFT_294636, partial [Tilletiaria anomala UBC 951]